jgi:hypothetical protein
MIKRFVERFIFTAIMGIMMACTESDGNVFTVVTDENYALAETQVIFADYRDRIAAVSGTGGTGVFLHNTNAADPNDKTVVRINFDTRYSMCLLDLKEDAVLTMPETGGRYQSAWFVTEEHYNPMAITAPGTYTLTEEMMGSRYVLIIVRTLVNMKDEKDMGVVTELQKQLKIEQADRGSYEPSCQWNMDEILAMRKKYVEIATEKRLAADDMFGKKGSLTQENHNCGVAYGWGGFTSDQAVYLSYIPQNEEPCTLTLKDVPVADNAFWSITIYDIEGYPQGNPYNINSTFAARNEDGSVTVHFGGDDKSVANYMEIFPGWTFILRLYLPQEEYFNKTWTKPELEYGK